MDDAPTAHVTSASPASRANLGLASTRALGAVLGGEPSSSARHHVSGTRTLALLPWRITARMPRPVTGSS